MCGIWGYLALCSSNIDESKLYEAFSKVKKRGPDRSDFRTINEFMKIYLGFHRLAIMDRSTNGDQPFTLDIKNEFEHKTIFTICNGEIYNHADLTKKKCI
jgi:asparagine synthase (glutamine-hydrolysing)